MPSVQETGHDINPSTAPLDYPGKLITGNCVLVDSWLYALDVGNAGSSEIGAWSVEIDEGPLGEERVLGRHPTLADVLELTEVSPIAQRHPVLAVGSNASPGQLRHKFGGQHERAGLVPVTRARATGLCIGHSAHVSKAGYIPFAPRAGHHDTRLVLSVLWLDTQQLLQLHETEPNYHWTVVDGDDYPAVLDSGQYLNTYSLYRGRWGLLRSKPNEAFIDATSQAGLFNLLASQSWFASLVPEVNDGAAAAIAALSSDPTRRNRVRETMTRQQLVADDDIEGSDTSAVSLRSPELDSAVAPGWQQLRRP